ncbi:ABC transporter permease [Luteimonas fraxinea]|uniref:ABC transporter permease n=1 Tax=Luteimonas fraxinea TaxID=2901869 RepID=UPI001E65861F|nr:ABC transporter permease [Luteimonas fraxinea]UHH09651.1 ABC transporter permease [Luteimonas fraxinea]
MDSRTLDIARFEFRRFFDLKGEIISIAILILIAAVRFGGDALMAVSTSKDIRISVETELSQLPVEASDRFLFTAVPPSARASSLDELNAGRIDGLIHEVSKGNYQLQTKDRVLWHEALVSDFTPIHQKLSSQRFGVSSADFMVLTTPPTIEPIAINAASTSSNSIGYGASIAILVLTILSIVSVLTLILQGIAGEKFGKISEIVLSAIPPSVWIDGKVIAALLHGLKTIFSYAIYGLAAALLLGFLTPQQMLESAHTAPMILLAALLSALGLLFWVMVFALVAALLPSAQSPIRNTLVLAPMTCLLLCLGGAKEPDNSFFVALSFFPPTMPFSMPLRIVSDTVAGWEIAVAILLLVATALLLRKLLIKVFSDSVLNTDESRAWAPLKNFKWRPNAKKSECVN